MTGDIFILTWPDYFYLYHVKRSQAQVLQALLCLWQKVSFQIKKGPIPLTGYGVEVT
jgi:hypothetical protein